MTDNCSFIDIFQFEGAELGNDEQYSDDDFDYFMNERFEGRRLKAKKEERETKKKETRQQLKEKNLKNPNSKKNGKLVFGERQSKKSRLLERSCMINKCVSEYKLAKRIEEFELKKNKKKGGLTTKERKMYLLLKKKHCSKISCQGLEGEDFNTCETCHCMSDSKKAMAEKLMVCVFGNSTSTDCSTKMEKFSNKNQQLLKDYCWDNISSNPRLKHCMQHIQTFDQFLEKTSTVNMQTIYKNQGYGHCRKLIHDRYFSCITSKDFNCKQGEEFKMCGGNCGVSCQNPKGYDVDCQTQDQTSCQPGCYCKEGYVPSPTADGSCIRTKTCPNRCGPKENEPCPKIKLQTYKRHIWRISLTTGTVLAVFSPLDSNEHKDYDIIIGKDLNVRVKQSIKGENDGPGVFQYKFLYQQEDIVKYFNFAERHSEDYFGREGNNPIKLNVENRSWLEIKLEWLDYDGHFVDYTGVINESKQTSNDKEKSSDAQSNASKIKAEKIIKCKSIRSEPCSYDENKITITNPAETPKIEITVFTMKGGDFQEALKALEEDLKKFKTALQTVEGINRSYQISLLSTVNIYLNDGIVFGKSKQSKDWSGSVFHPGRPWLAENGNTVDGKVVKVGAVEFYTVEDYLSKRSHNGHYKSTSFWQLTHELSHWYHWYLTNYGYSSIDDTWQKVMNPKNRKEYIDYNSVPHITGEHKKAYATVNSQEYFASLSAAYFSPSNDYFPFNLEDLKGFDHSGYEMVKRFWKLGKRGVIDRHDRAFDVVTEIVEEDEEEDKQRAERERDNDIWGWINLMT